MMSATYANLTYSMIIKSMFFFHCPLKLADCKTRLKLDANYHCDNNKRAINTIIYIIIELQSNIKFTLTKSRRYFFSSVHFCNCFSASACEIPLYSDKIAASVSFTPLAIPFASLMAM